MKKPTKAPPKKSTKSAPRKQIEKEVRIVIAQRGWVFVGYYTATKDEVRLDNAQCIRRWGTAKGLGELRSGPTSSTVLNPAGVVRMHPLVVIATIDCEVKPWIAVLV